MKSYPILSLLRFAGVIGLCTALGAAAQPKRPAAPGSSEPIFRKPGLGAFSLVMTDGRVLHPQDFKISVVDANCWRFAGPARRIQLIEQRIPPMEHRPYERLVLEVWNRGQADLAVARIVMLDQPAPAGAKVDGTCPGSPVVIGNVFCGVEHPLANNRVVNGRVVCSLSLPTPLGPGDTATASLVVGWSPEASQLRRTFQAYLEDQRIRPYAPFLCHNTWYDQRYPYSERDELRVIRKVGRELVERRGVRFDAFVLDDGWDDHRSLWQFSNAWPAGLTRVRAAAKKFRARPGIWLSPWGGYGRARTQRMEAAASDGFETHNGRFSLAGPKYYARFQSVCVNLVRKQGVVFFKFDGIGADAHGRIDPTDVRDIFAMLRLDRELHRIGPGLYISQTTGTWPSPWFLFYADNVWRGGKDHAFAGVGSYRQQWITYRDEATYRRVVRTAPLYPLNSLMLHGIIDARFTRHLAGGSDQDFRCEVRTYFGSGTQLQELYISPELLDKENWDDLAAAAKWSRTNADTLRDTHWVGGDPGKLQVYGWAAWSPAKGLLTLRNPSDKPAVFVFDPVDVFELPRNAARRFNVTGAYPDSPAPIKHLEAGTRAEIRLQPFEVLVLEATPVGR